MKYIFITYSGLCLPIAYKLQQEGHEVLVGHIQNIKDYVMEEESAGATETNENRELRLSLFQGVLNIEDADKIIEKAKDIKNPYDYFVFFEENNLYRWADKFKDLGFEGNFPTKEDYLFEIDRNHAKEFVKKHYPKLYTPQVHEFDTVAKGIEFLNSTNEMWVLKGRDDSAKTLVPDSADPQLAKEQIIEMLENFPKKYEKLGFILELFIPQIIEFTPEKMYYDGVPLAVTIGIENKQFAAGNISVQTGCSEDMVFPIDMEDRIAKIAFPEVVDQMARDHKGLFIWDASLLVDKRDGKIYFGEFCSNRPGYNSFFSELSLCSSVNAFFEDVVHKKNPFPLGTVASSVRIFNLNHDEETAQVSADLTLNFKPEIEKDLWFWDVKRNVHGKLVSVGYDWNLLVVTGAGKSIDESTYRLYKNIEGLSFLGAYYRSKDDYLSLDYNSSILNRLNYGLERGLYKLPFNVMAGEIK